MTSVVETTVREVSGLEPKSTAVAPMKPLPVTVTEVPPVVGPLGGLTEETDGVIPTVVSMIVPIWSSHLVDVALSACLGE